MIQFQSINNFKSYQNHWGPLETTSPSLSTDTRTLKKGQAFLGLVGPNFDGFNFAETALEKEIAVLIVEGKGREEQLEQWSQSYPNCLIVACHDSLNFLQELSVDHLKRWEELGEGRLTLGITGSNGKTTHKEMLAELLNGALPNKVFYSRGNLNNHIGVPLSLLSLKEKHRVGIIEMGTNHPGEIEALAKLAHPRAGLISNIGQAHIEFFKSLESIFEEKTALYRQVVANTNGEGVFVVDGEDDYLSTLEEKGGLIKVDSRHVMYDWDQNSFSLNWENSVLTINNEQIFGEHNFKNLARCCILALKLFPEHAEEIVEAANNFSPPSMNRSNWIQRGEQEIFLDAYNANPSSMRAALSSFVSGIQRKGGQLDQCLIVLGDMNELGEATPELHGEIGSLLNELGVVHAYFVGRYSQHYQKTFSEGKTFPEKSQLEAEWKKSLSRYRYVFLKGSRTLQLESLVDI